jgi:hypothetical protein
LNFDFNHADTNPDLDPAFHSNADPCTSGSGSAALMKPFLKMEENFEKIRLHFSKGDLFKADYFRQTLIPTQIDSKLPL